MNETFWLQHATGKWHFWLKKVGVTACGRLNAESLRRKPPRDVRAELPDEHYANRCAACAKKDPNWRPPKSGEAAQDAWAGFVRRHALYKKVRIAQDDVAALAERLASFGAPGEPAAMQAWDQIKMVLLTPVAVRREKRTVLVFHGLREALKLLPPGGPELPTIVTATSAWRRVMNGAGVGQARSDKIVKGMLAIKDPESYLRHLKEHGFTSLSSVFSHGTIERAKHDPALRGMWAGGSEHWEKIKGSLNIITDEEEG